MKCCVIVYTIIVALTSLLRITCAALEITNADFTWKLIQDTLNCSKNSENFVIAPHEAYQLYKEIYNIEDVAENNADLKDPESNTNQDDQYLNTVLSPLRKQLKTLSSSRTNQTDLLETISLTARWSFNFQTRDTHKRVFHQLGKPNQKLWLDYLRKDDIFYYSHNEQLNASILELPLNIKKIKLVIILPDQWNALPDLKEYFLENINEFKDLIDGTHKMVLVRVFLPKFQLTYKKDFTDIFEEISSKEVENYGNIYQLSNLEFNERGIGRFEKTTVLFWNAYSYLRVAPEVFDINHPFLFLIINQDGIQFFGQVVKMQH